MHEILLKDQEFVEAWIYYKDYLSEKGAKIKSEAIEQLELEKLFILSGESPKQAVWMLNRLMINSYTVI